MKPKKKNLPRAEYRIRFETKDGSVIMNRKSEIGVVNPKSKEYWGDYVQKNILKKDAQEKGVRIISQHHRDLFTLVAIVEYV